MKHKHADLIIAWANGAEIQFREYAGEWNDFQPNGYACWHQDMEYRIKPKLKPDFVYHVSVKFGLDGLDISDSTSRRKNVTFVFDGETNEIKSAEVIK